MHQSRHTLTRLLGLICCIAATALPGLQAQPGGSRPNILFILADDMRYDAMGIAGNTIVQTPNLDRLAGEGVLFSNSFVTTSVCACNRAVILSGQYPRTSGVRGFAEDFTPETQDKLYPFLAQDAGYVASFFGKWGVASTIPEILEKYAERFDHWRGFYGQGKYFPDGPQGKHLTRIMAEDVDAFLAQQSAERPFIASVSLKAPHGPWHAYPREYGDWYPPEAIPLPETLTEEAVAELPPFMRTYRLSLNGQSIESVRGFHQRFVSQYYRLITGIDDTVGRIRESLAKYGFDDNTVIVFGSDNGHFIHEWGFHGKWLMYEPSIRVPLIVYDPRLPASQRGRVEDRIVVSLDYAPTFLDLAGADIPESMQGRSFVPLIRGESVDDWRKDFFYEFNFGMFPGDIPASVGVRGERYKYVRYVSEDPHYEQLFDLQEDPAELVNLAKDPAYANILETMRARLETYLQKIPDNLRDPEEFPDLVYVEHTARKMPDQNFNTSRQREVGQSFVARTNRLESIAWRGPLAMNFRPQSDISLEIRETGPDGPLLMQKTIPGEKHYSLHYLEADLGVDVEKGKEYYVGFNQVDNDSQEDKFMFWGYKDDVYRSGEAYYNGKPFPGDLALSFVYGR